MNPQKTAAVRTKKMAESIKPSTKPTGEFRGYMPNLSLPRFTTMQGQDAHEYVKAFKTKQHPPWLYNLYLHWRELYQEPYKGVTTDGMYQMLSKTHYIMTNG
jgi:hypothetical protein